jgi:hypothetical protein
MESHTQHPAYLDLNRSFFTLKDCINSFGEVEELLTEVSARLEANRTYDSKPATARASSLRKRTNVPNIYQDISARSRQSKRMSVSPGPGQYFTRPVTSHQPEARMQGRPELPALSNAGPTGHSVLQKEDVKFGYWTREPRYKQVIHEDSHLGPGTYDVRSFIERGVKGSNKDSGKSDNSMWTTSELTLGPGQYMMHEGTSSRGFTIAKTKRVAGAKFNPHLGPGKYELAVTTPNASYKFSTSPRFDNSFNEKINSED